MQVFLGKQVKLISDGTWAATIVSVIQNSVVLSKLESNPRGQNKHDNEYTKRNVPLTAVKQYTQDEKSKTIKGKNYIT